MSWTHVITAEHEPKQLPVLLYFLQKEAEFESRLEYIFTWDTTSVIE